MILVHVKLGVLPFSWCQASAQLLVAIPSVFQVYSEADGRFAMEKLGKTRGKIGKPRETPCKNGKKLGKTHGKRGKSWGKPQENGGLPLW